MEVQKNGQRKAQADHQKHGVFGRMSQVEVYSDVEHIHHLFTHLTVIMMKSSLKEMMMDTPTDGDTVIRR